MFYQLSLTSVSLVARIPGMISGKTKRNLVVALLYVILSPFIIIFSPLIAFFLVGTNRNSITDRIIQSRLNRLPGLKTRGWKAGVAAFVYVFVVLLVVGAALPGSDTTTPQREASAVDTTTVGTTATDSPTIRTSAAKTSTRAPDTTSEKARTKHPTAQHSTTPVSTAPSPTSISHEESTRSSKTPEQTSQQTSKSTPRSSSWTKTTVTIVRIVDGDTVEFTYQNGTKDTGRLLGVDTPEVHTENDPAEFEGIPNTDTGASCLRDWGHKASEFARSELAGERVTIMLDEREGPRGYYGRLLIYIRDDGKLFNYRLVKQGYARVYDSDFTKQDRFYTAESNAQKNGIGLWECRQGQQTTQSPAEHGGSEGTLEVARLHIDAAGNDHDNLNEEYIVFENTGGEPLDLSGWTIADEAGHDYSVPPGVTVKSGETVTLYTGSGSNSVSKLYWESRSAIWNNGGDTIIITNEDGTVVLQKEYT